MPQTTVISFFTYHGFGKKWKALGRMGRPPLLKHSIPGLTFWKSLGSGSGNGFSIWPDFSTFGLLTVFNSEIEGSRDILEPVEIRVKYRGYIDRQNEFIRQSKKLENMKKKDQKVFTERLTKTKKTKSDINFIRKAMKKTGALEATENKHREMIQEAREKLTILSMKKKEKDVLRGLVEKIAVVEQS